MLKEELLQEIRQTKRKVYDSYKKGKGFSVLAEEFDLTKQGIEYYVKSYIKSMILKGLDEKYKYPKKLPPRGDDIAKIIVSNCFKYKVSYEDLLSPKRNQDIVKARKDISRELKELGLTYVAIGEILNIDRTVAMYFLRTNKK